MVYFDDKLCRGRTAYDNLAKLHTDIVSVDETDVSIAIKTEGKFGKTFVFLIPCLYYLAAQYGKNSKITVSKGIYEKLGDLSKISQQHTLPLKTGFKVQLIQLKDEETAQSLSKQIAEDMPVEMSPLLHETIVAKIGEMFNNARGHSEAEYVLAGGYLNSFSGGGKRLCFMCYDTGIGIPDKVRGYLDETKDSLRDKQALGWALEPYNSTAGVEGIPRGQGFSLLREFVCLNRGVIRICTGNVLYTYDCRLEGSDPKEKFQELKHTFRGTLFEMHVNPDGRRYQYKGESR